MTTQFDDIYHELGLAIGKFRMANSGMAWMNNETKEVVTVQAGDIKWASWMRVARNFRLRLGLKEKGKRVNFEGFQRDDHDKLSSLMRQHYSISLENKEVSFKGWNWGATDFQGNDLAFLVSNKTSFELPLQKVNNSNIASKTEVSLEFVLANPRPSKGAGDELVEARFYVPGTTTKEAGSDAENEDEKADEEETTAAQAFHDAVKDKAEIGEVVGDVIINFEEVLVLTPRGRYDVDMFGEFLRLRGKTYDYKINYNGISRLFLLPKDDQHVLFILGLVNPIRQGQTRYQFLVMQFDRDEEVTAELNMDEEKISSYDKLQKHYDGHTFEVVSAVFRSLANKKIIGSGTFQNRNGHPGIKANLKAIQGDLFILEKFIFFVAKAPLLIELSDIHQVNFSRVGGAMATSRTFDIVIMTKDGVDHTFSSIVKEEFDNVESYLRGKKLKIKNAMAEELVVPALGDDDDEEMESDASSGSEVVKPRGGDDEDSEEDEDFQASSSDEGSPSSSSDSEDEGAASVSDASGDRDIANVSKKKKGDKKKKKSAAAGKKTKESVSDNEDGADAMDVDEKPPKAKSKPKPRPKTKDSEGDGPVKKKLKREDD